MLIQGFTLQHRADIQPFTHSLAWNLQNTDSFKCHLHATLGFPGGSLGKESTCNAEDAGDLSSFPGLGRTAGGGHGNPLQYSCLENPMNREAWRATVHGVTKSQTRLKLLSMHGCICHPSPKFHDCHFSFIWWNAPWFLLCDLPHCSGSMNLICYTTNMSLVVWLA